MSSPIGRRPFGLSLAWTVVACLGLILAGLLLVFLWAENSTVAGLGGAIFSLGVVTLISEFYLKSTYTRDLIELVDLANHVRSVGFLGARIDRQVPWSEVFSGATHFRFYLPQPIGWTAREWPEVLQQAGSRSVTVELYLPDPAGAGATAQAQLLGHSPQLFCDSIRDIASNIGQEWRAGLGNGAIKAKSQLSIFLVTDAMPYGLAAVDGQHFLLAYDVPGGAPTGGPMALQFSRQDLEYPVEWFRRQWSSIAERHYDKAFESAEPPRLIDARRPLEERP